MGRRIRTGASPHPPPPPPRSERRYAGDLSPHRAGQRLNSPALIADGQHARADAYVSLGVVVSAGVVAIGVPVADPVIGLAITAVILRITWQSWRTMNGVTSRTAPGRSS
ncbi:MAG TPA: cation transporter [Acidimicrobiia bacterium]|nr:cation transporter [Acidimicrobiia bacterium]